MVVKKQHLPSKICVVCTRHFSWRKKWERDWENVRHCSDRCRKTKSHPSPQNLQQ
ncbi:MAG: DUF2256 domain-containing protein [Cryomorphaceae bacterium]|nr:DUF2256 domain-containing protein [Cryomorphaceae bacterium]